MTRVCSYSRQDILSGAFSPGEKGIYKMILEHLAILYPRHRVFSIVEVGDYQQISPSPGEIIRIRPASGGHRSLGGTRVGKV